MVESVKWIYLWLWWGHFLWVFAKCWFITFIILLFLSKFWWLYDLRKTSNFWDLSQPKTWSLDKFWLYIIKFLSIWVESLIIVVVSSIPTGHWFSLSSWLWLLLSESEIHTIDLLSVWEVSFSIGMDRSIKFVNGGGWALGWSSGVGFDWSSWGGFSSCVGFSSGVGFCWSCGVGFCWSCDVSFGWDSGISFNWSSWSSWLFLFLLLSKISWLISLTKVRENVDSTNNLAIWE
jgi:hypothetical protein